MKTGAIIAFLLTVAVQSIALSIGNHDETTSDRILSTGFAIIMIASAVFIFKRSLAGWITAVIILSLALIWYFSAFLDHPVLLKSITLWGEILLHSAALLVTLSGTLEFMKSKKTEPNQAPETTILTVTDRAPSSTLRASEDRVSP